MLWRMCVLPLLWSSSKHCHSTAEMSDPMSFLSSSVGWPLMTFCNTLWISITFFSSTGSASGWRRSMWFFLKRALTSTPTLYSDTVSGFFPLFTCIPHTDCCANACCKPMLQTVEGSIVMNSRVGGILLSILLVRGSIIHSGPLYTAWPVLIWLLFNHSKIDLICFELVILLSHLVFVVKAQKGCTYSRVNKGALSTHFGLTSSLNQRTETGPEACHCLL